MMRIIRQLLEPWLPHLPASINRPYCHVCTDMFGTARGIKAMCSVSGYRHYNEQECRRSASKGCLLCEIIVEYGWAKYAGRNAAYLERRRRETEGLSNYDLPMNFICQPLKESRMDFDFYFNDPSLRSETWQLKDAVWLHGGILEDGKDMSKRRMTRSSIFRCAILASGEDPAAGYFPRRPICDTFFADPVMNDVENWMRDCLEGRHSNCLIYKDLELPTRVIKVGDSGSSIINLRHTDIDERGRYAALSYCWGGPQPVTATKGNIDQLENGFQITSLPQTLQDAVLTTRRLGLQYLWVDALCIIQDDPEDKEREIQRMGRIYRCSVVTIAAAATKSAYDGFLKCSMTHKPPASCTITIRLPGPPAKAGTITLAPEFSHTVSHAPPPLRTRGWAFQETVLSPRLLAFASDQAFYTCATEPARTFNSGCLPHVHMAPLSSLYVRFFDELEQFRTAHGDGWMTASYLSSLWANVLGDFTMRALTVWDDRLPAVQGLANELLSGGHLGADVERGYVAGMWVAGLPQLLLWCRSDKRTLVPAGGGGGGGGDGESGETDIVEPLGVLARAKRAPSWSWACLDCPIVFNAVDDDVEQCDMTCSVMEEDHGQQILEVNCETRRRSIEEFNNDKSITQDVRLNLDLDVDELEPGAGEVHYLLCAKYTWPEGIDGSTEEPMQLLYVSGLVVQQATENVFKRLGYFRWDVCKPLQEYVFGQRRTIKLA